MSRTIRGLFVMAAVGALAVLSAPVAEATCAPASVIFGQFGYGCSGGAAYCYVTSPGGNSNASIFGTFWDVGLGNTAAGLGNDNGGYADDGWLSPYAGKFYLNGNPGWGNASVDGCPGATSSMVAAFSDESADGSQAYFAAACVARDPAQTTEYDFAFGIGQDIALVAIQGVTIVASNKLTDTQSEVTVAAPDFSAGFYSDGSAGCTLAAVIPEYDVYAFQGTEGAGPPGDRDTTAGWNLVGTFASGVNGTVTLTSTCGGTNDCSHYLAVSPRYADGFGTGDGAGTRRVGTRSTRVDTGPNVADPIDKKFKLIDRKGDVKKGGSRK